MLGRIIEKCEGISQISHIRIRQNCEILNQNERKSFTNIFIDLDFSYKCFIFECTSLSDILVHIQDLCPHKLIKFNFALEL